LLRFLDYILHGPKGTLVAVGKTNSTLKRNFVDPLFEMLGIDVKFYAGKQEVVLYGRTIVLIGANDERAEGKIRGNTFAGAMVDEATLLPESFFVTLLARLSLPGAQVFLTTNPDSPFHWLKKNYIDRIDEIDLKLFSFNLEDNPSLTETFKNNLKREFRGLWYKRFIEGQWCLAEGVIYDFFDERIHCLDLSPTSSRYFVCGVDYGTTNPCAFTLVGYDPSAYPNLWVEDEYVWDSRERNRQKTDSEYAEDLKKFLANKNVKAVVIDPSAASFKVECTRQGIQNIMDANNDVLDGIRYTSKLLSNGTLKVCKKCKNLIKEIQTYSWDEKSLKLGEDRPLKQNDHCFVAGAMVSTSNGQVPIEQVKEGDLVLTPIGYKRVLKTFIHEAEVIEYNILGKRITCTPEHKFFTANRGWIKAQDLTQSDTFLVNTLEERCLIQSSGMGINGIEAELQKIYVIEDITEDMIRQLKKTDISIEMFGNSIMERFHEDTIFITSMKTQQTMTLAISNVSELLNIYPIIKKILQKARKTLED
jgi:PBSX family phage terminase large subunit